MGKNCADAIPCVSVIFLWRGINQIYWMRVNTGLAKRCHASQICWFFEGLHQHMDGNDSVCIISLDFRQRLLHELSWCGAGWQSARGEKPAHISQLLKRRGTSNRSISETLGSCERHLLMCCGTHAVLRTPDRCTSRGIAESEGVIVAPFGTKLSLNRRFLACTQHWRND